VQLKVVYLSVVDNHNGAILVEQGLMAAGQIDNGQPPVAQAKARLQVQPALVRPTVKLGFVHAPQQRFVDLAPGTGVENAYDAAHSSF